MTALAVQNAQSWREAAGKSTQGKRIFDLLRMEMDGPVGIVMRGMVARHALLIRTMPQNIAQDIASQIATRQMRGERAETIAASIYERIPEITASRIAMLARTEVGSTATAISRARSENLGLPCYEWLSSEDVRVRPSHRKMDHVLVLWSDPPAPEMLATRQVSVWGIITLGKPLDAGATPMSSLTSIKSIGRTSATLAARSPAWDAHGF